MPPVNKRNVEWTETEHGETRFLRKQLSAAANEDGDPDLGCSLYELPPGGRAWPYHYHAGNAEAIYVIEGEGQLRLDGDVHQIEAGDYVPFPAGPAGAHRVINDSGGPLQYLAISEMTAPDVTVYPDSEKLGVYTGAPPGGRTERPVEGYYRIDDDVSYWDGE